MRTFDLAIPSQLSAALIPDLLLMGGIGAPALGGLAKGVGLASAQRRRSPSGFAWRRSSPSCLMMYRARRRTTDGPIAVDNFRWMADIIILLEKPSARSHSVSTITKQ